MNRLIYQITPSSIPASSLALYSIDIDPEMSLPFLPEALAEIQLRLYSNCSPPALLSIESTLPPMEKDSCICILISEFEALVRLDLSEILEDMPLFDLQYK